MELIYSMRRKPLKCQPPQYESPNDQEVTRPICTISTANIIAFSSPTELSDTDGDTWGGHVYVCDLDTPWDAHKVTSTSYPVSSLEWDIEGKQLLVATTVGDVLVFTQKEYLLNEWACLYTASYPGEHIIKASFFHNGRRIVAVEKKADASITERFQVLRSTPTLKGFGGASCEGVCAVTATGLLGVATPPAGGARAQQAAECLRAARDHVAAASIAHKNGSVVVAALCRAARGRCCVRCYACRVAPGAAAPLLSVQPLPTVYLPAADLAHHTPASITWCTRDGNDSLLIAGSVLTMWKCTERSHQVHKFFSKGPLQGSTTPGGGPKTADTFTTLVWQKTGAWPIEGGERCVHAASARSTLGAPHVVAATPRAVHLLARDTHHFLCTRAVITSGTGTAAEVAAGATPPKKPKYGHGSLPAGAPRAAVSCVDMSLLGGVAVAIDTHAQLHVYRVQPWDMPTPLAVQYATTLLEYSIVTGCDCLDILMTLKHSLVEPVYERLTETFQRQPQAFQQYYFHSWLKQRTALCRIMPSAQASVSWLTCLQTIRASWAAVSSTLRPDDKPEDKPFTALLDEHGHDQDKCLLTLESKTEILTEAICLQPLRLILQRAIDIALTALLALSYQHQHQIHPHGYELWAEGAALQLLRRLVVAARCSLRAGEPLSRPLARLAACAAPKPDLVEDCATLAAQWSGARVWESLPRCCVCAPHGKPWPLYFEYGADPEHLRYTPESPPYAQCETTPSTTMDSIRYMYLGGGRRAPRYRQCSRCGSRALPVAQPSRHPTQRAYDARFLTACSLQTIILKQRMKHILEAALQNVAKQD